MRMSQRLMKYIYIVLFIVWGTQKRSSSLVHSSRYFVFVLLKIIYFSLCSFFIVLSILFSIFLMWCHSLPFIYKQHRKQLRKHLTQPAQTIHHWTRDHQSCFAELYKIWGFKNGKKFHSLFFLLMWAVIWILTETTDYKVYFLLSC